MLQNLVKKISQLFSNNSFKTVTNTVLLFIVFFSLGADTTFASTSTQESFVDIILIFLHFLVYLSWIVIGAMGSLLSNDLVMDPTIVPTLHYIWTIVRNLVNIVFIGVLLYMAFRTIFNFDDDTSFFKDNILKLIGAIVLVNFSFLAVKVLIDVSTVATHAAFSLSKIVPQENNQMLCKTDGDTNCGKQVFSIRYNKKLKTQSEENATKCTDDDKNCKESSKMTMSRMMFVQPYAEGLTDGDRVKNIKDDAETLNQYAKLNHMKLKDDKDSSYNISDSRYQKWIETEKAAGKDYTASESSSLVAYFEEWRNSAMIVITVIDGSTDPTGISNRSIVPMIAYNLTPLEEFLWKDRDSQTLGTLVLETLFSLVFSILLLLAFIAMFIVLLIRVAVLWVGIIASPLLVFLFFDFLGFADSINDAVKKVVHHAFIPAIFGVVLSLTFILIGQLNYNKVLYTTDTIYMNGGSINAGDPLFNFIFMVLIVIFFWMGVWWALRLSEFAENIIKPIKDRTEQFGGWLAKRPLSIDFIPVPQGSGGDVARTNFKNLFEYTKGAANAIGHDEQGSKDALTHRIDLTAKEYKSVDRAIKSSDKNETESLRQAINSGRTASQMQGNEKVMDGIRHIIAQDKDLEKRYRSADKGKKAEIEASIINKFADKHGSSTFGKKHVNSDFIIEYLKSGHAASGSILDKAAQSIKGINKAGEVDKFTKALKDFGGSLNNIKKEDIDKEFVDKLIKIDKRFQNKTSQEIIKLLNEIRDSGKKDDQEAAKKLEN